uniref:Putative secreted protein n=1 Tax=Ixodes ricinus TaxID=34613 RepID=A0A6B0UF96_IXORI
MMALWGLAPCSASTGAASSRTAVGVAAAVSSTVLRASQTGVSLCGSAGAAGPASPRLTLMLAWLAPPWCRVASPLQVPSTRPRDPAPCGCGLPRPPRFLNS